MKNKVNLDIIMLSNFDKNGGGRETWLYNFLPEILKTDKIGQIKLFGYRNDIDKNFDSELIALEGSSIGINRLESIIFQGKTSRIPMVFKMYNLLKNYRKKSIYKPDITLAMGVFELIMMLRIKRFKSSKKVVWLRSIFSHEKAYIIPKFMRRLFLYFEVRMLKKVDILISNGDDIKSFYEKYGLRINVIKNGVVLEKWKMKPPQLKERIQVAYIGRLSKVKGIEAYFDLINRIKTSSYSEKFDFHIVGNIEDYKYNVQNLESKRWVINHGLIPNDELPFFLKNIDVCVALTFASDSLGGGGTSNAMLEQMAASKIMLAWDNVIFRQYLNNRNSYLVNQYDIEMLYDTLIYILKDKSEALKKCKRSLEVVKPYTYSENVNKFITLIT